MARDFLHEVAEEEECDVEQDDSEVQDPDGRPPTRQFGTGARAAPTSDVRRRLARNRAGRYEVHVGDDTDLWRTTSEGDSDDGAVIYPVALVDDEGRDLRRVPMLRKAAGPGMPRTTRVVAATGLEYRAQSRRCCRQPVYPTNDTPSRVEQLGAICDRQISRLPPAECMGGTYRVGADGVESYILHRRLALGIFNMYYIDGRRRWVYRPFVSFCRRPDWIDGSSELEDSQDEECGRVASWTATCITCIKIEICINNARL